MPTYKVIAANLALTPEQEAEIAAAITRSHHESTGAPAYFAQVFFFSPIDKGRHYIGGKPYNVPHLFVHGLIRAGRSSDVKSALVKDIATRVHTIAGVGPEDVWVYVQDIAATQMVEFGRVLPEPGAEESWRAAMSAQKRQDLEATGAL